jgi:hypothetical protein
MVLFQQYGLQRAIWATTQIALYNMGYNGAIWAYNACNLMQYGLQRKINLGYNGRKFELQGTMQYD